MYGTLKLNTAPPSTKKRGQRKYHQNKTLKPEAEAIKKRKGSSTAKVCQKVASSMLFCLLKARFVKRNLLEKPPKSNYTFCDHKSGSLKVKG
jgi:hypothetical protein